MQAIQLLTTDYVQQSSLLSPSERLDFLEEFRFLIPLAVFEDRLQLHRAHWKKATKEDAQNHSP